MRQIMRSSLDYAGFAQLCGRSPIMREIMRAHNRRGVGTVPTGIVPTGTVPTGSIPVWHYFTYAII